MITYCLFRFGVNQVHCLSLKSRPKRSISCVLHRLKSRSSGEGIEMSAVCHFMSLILRL